MAKTMLDWRIEPANPRDAGKVCCWGGGECKKPAAYRMIFKPDPSIRSLFCVTHANTCRRAGAEQPRD